MSVWVQALPSSQAAPSDLLGVEQSPLCGSQTPASWHWSTAGHSIGFAPVQVPAWHESLCVQALPSLQAEPSCFAGFEQLPVAGSQTVSYTHLTLPTNREV